MFHRHLPTQFPPIRVWRASFFLCLTVLFALGCGGGPALPPLAPVKGTVSVDGQPLTSGNVVLNPETVEPGATGTFSAGQVDANGNYEIFTGGKAGAPLKKYKVVVTPSTVPMDPAKAGANVAVNPKYRNQSQTPLGFEVIATPAAGRYDLKLSK